LSPAWSRPQRYHGWVALKSLAPDTNLAASLSKDHRTKPDWIPIPLMGWWTVASSTWKKCSIAFHSRGCLCSKNRIVENLTDPAAGSDESMAGARVQEMPYHGTTECSKIPIPKN